MMPGVHGVLKCYFTVLKKDLKHIFNQHYKVMAAM